METRKFSLHRFFFHTCTLGLLLYCAVGVGADWPRWRGVGGDGHSPETGLLQRWPETGLQPLWTFEDLGLGYSSAAIAGGVVYVTGMEEETKAGTLFAFDEAGALLWKIVYGAEWGGTHPGTRSMPTVEKDAVYLMTGLGEVVCLDAKSGAIRWRRDVATEFGGEAPAMGFAEALLVVGDTVICTPGGAGASIAALEKLTGKVRWKSKELSEQSAYCSPMLVERGGNRLIITLLVQSLVALDPATGGILWRQPFDAEEELQNHCVTPVYADGVLYVTSGHRAGGQCYALSADGKGVTLKWEDEILNAVQGGVVLVDGFLYGTSSKGKWICLDRANGQVMYEEKGVGKGALIYADGMLYCYGEKGSLALTPATPQGFAPVSQFKIPLGAKQHWSHPTLANGQLYIRHGNALMVYGVATP
jgi:outer membrane protein assembly factor BamB